MLHKKENDMKTLLMIGLLFSTPAYAGCEQGNLGGCESIPPEYQSAPQPKQHSFTEPWGYSDDRGWHGYQHGEPHPGGGYGADE
jgi:hypothetical protein